MPKWRRCGEGAMGGKWLDAWSVMNSETPFLLTGGGKMKEIEYEGKIYVQVPETSACMGCDFRYSTNCKQLVGDVCCYTGTIWVEKEEPKQNGGSTPSQYSFPEGSKELQDLIEHRDMNFAMGNIFKACYRMGQKEGVSDEYNLNKILFFAARELSRISKNK